MKHTPETVVLVNCGCEEIQTVARGVRAEHIYSMVMPYTVSVERILEEKPQAVIFCADAPAEDRIARFDNYEWIFKESSFFEGLWLSLQFTFITTIVQTILGFIMAYMLYRMTPVMQGAYRVILYLPNILPATTRSARDVAA